MSFLICKSILKKNAYITQHFCALHVKQWKKNQHQKKRNKAEQIMQCKKINAVIMLLLHIRTAGKYMMYI